MPSKKTQNFTAKVKLPDYLTCKACILQWKYHSGNNYGRAYNSDLLCLGCVERQEEFYNCADIAILKSNSSINQFDEGKHSNLFDQIFKIFKNSASYKYGSINLNFLYSYIVFILYKLKY